VAPVDVKTWADVDGLWRSKIATPAQILKTYYLPAVLDSLNSQSVLLGALSGPPVSGSPGARVPLHSRPPQ
jgi:hypothetical protein